MDFTRQLALMTSQTSVHTHVSPSQPNMPIKPQQLTSMLAGPSGMMPSMPAAKRQKLYDGYQEQGSDDEDNGGKGRANKQTVESKRSQHCEVEKRRRERMNRYMTELAQMIPACNAVPRRLDKLSILKMAVDHMKNLRGDPHSSSDYKPGFLTDDELKQLVVEAANGFMIIIECSQARVLFVSDTISEVLHEQPEDWIGSCLYDLLHPKDIHKCREQLACFDVEEALKSSVRHNVSDSPLVTHTQQLNGLRRSFLCRVKRTNNSGQTQSDLSSLDVSTSEDMIKLFHSTQQGIPYQYAVLHCTGFIRNLTNAERQSLRVDESVPGACLVAVARLQHFGDSSSLSRKPTLETGDNEFVSRVGVDGRFTYVDPRVTSVLGHLPQDLIGQVSYEYYHPEDIQKMVHLHHDSMKRRTPMPTVQYRFLSKTQKWVWLAMKSFSFVNPFSQQVEYVVCTNVALRSGVTMDPPASSATGVEGLSSNSAMVLHGGDQGGGFPSMPVQDTDKQERIERYVRMSISNQVEQQLLSQQNKAPPQPDPLVSLLVSTSDLSSQFIPPAPSIDTSSNISSVAMTTNPHTMDGNEAISQGNEAGPSYTPTFSQAGTTGQVFSSPADTTFEENAATVQRILEEYHRLTAEPPNNKDMNYQFPPDLFTTEVDLEGSQQAYRNLLTELDNPADFGKLFNQVEADPLRPQTSLFQDINLDIFD